MLTDESPRSRLLEHGSAVLSDAELLAVLFQTKGNGSVLKISRTLLESAQGLSGFAGRSAPAWVALAGIGPARSAALLATVELARRIARSGIDDRAPMDQPAAIARFLALRYVVPDQEVIGALFLDSRHRLIAEQEIFRGTLNRAVAEPRTILKQALLLNAPAVVLFHTHPSGDPTPSPEDLAFTRRLVKAGDVVGVELLDHFILGGPTTWVSLRERGAW